MRFLNTGSTVALGSNVELSSLIPSETIAQDLVSSGFSYEALSKLDRATLLKLGAQL